MWMGIVDFLEANKYESDCLEILKPSKATLIAIVALSDTRCAQEHAVKFVKADMSEISCPSANSIDYSHSP